MTRDGAKLSPGLLYIHIDPAGSFVAAGFYHPEPPQLYALRQRLADRPDSWRDTERQLAEKGLELSKGEALVRTPRGFEAVVEPAQIEILKLKSWIVSRPLDEVAVEDPGLVDGILEFAEAAEPLLSFGWAAIAP